MGANILKYAVFGGLLLRSVSASPYIACTWTDGECSRKCQNSKQENLEDKTDQDNEYNLQKGKDNEIEKYRMKWLNNHRLLDRHRWLKKDLDINFIY